MHKRLQQFKEYRFHSKLILFFFCLDLFFMILAFITTLLPSENTQLFLIILISTAIIMLIHTAALCINNLDYIQGFYCAKSDPELTPVIAKDLLQKIQEINYKKLSETPLKKNYETRGEIDLIPADIVSGNFSAIVILEKEITIKGRPGECYNLFIIIPDNQTSTITLENLSLSSEDRPCFIIGINCSVTMKLVGDNYFYHDGIRVPETSELTILGDGNLTLQADRSSKTGIGGSESQSYGNITLATTGQINVSCSGSTAIGIGGGQNPSNSLIRLLSGNISVGSSGFTAIAIGSLLGNANVFVDDCILNIKAEGTKSIGIGCVMGMVNIITRGNLDINCSGQNCIAIGTLEEGNGLITITGGNLKIYFNAYSGTGIGSISDKIMILLQNGDVMVHGEGVDIVAIGDHSGLGELKITNGILSIQLIANNSLLTSNLPQKIIIDGGNIQCNFPESITLVNSYGASLVPHIITDTDDFSQIIETIFYRYEYRASYSPRYPYIKVYLPENLAIDNFHR